MRYQKGSMMSAVEFNTYENLTNLVNEHDGLVTCYMASLRDSHGVGKLGIHVVANISDELAKRGLEHFPNDLPVNGGEPVRVFRSGTTVSKLFKSINSPHENDSNKFIQEICAESANQKMKKIKEIVLD